MAQWRRKNPNAHSPSEQETYVMTRSTISAVLRCEYLTAAMFIILAELLTLFYSWFIGQFVIYLENPDAS